MHDVKAMMQQQAAWQRSRARLSWSVKLRMAEIMRKAQRSLRRSDIRPADMHKGESR